MDRRDFLAGIIQALLLALFPWLRAGRGPELARAAAEEWVAEHVFVLQPGGVAAGNVFTDWATLYAKLSATEGKKKVFIDDTFAASTPVAAGTYDLRDTMLVAGDAGGHLAIGGEGSVDFIIGETQ